MVSTETKIWQGLKARVQTLAGFTAAQIAWPMEPFTPPVSGGNPQPWLKVSHLPNVVVRRFIGSDDPQERPGILQITLCWPVSEVGTGSGKTDPDVLIQRAGLIAGHFPADLAMDFQGVRACVERAPDVAQPYRDDAYWRVPVSIRYRTFA